MKIKLKNRQSARLRFAIPVGRLDCAHLATYNSRMINNYSKGLAWTLKERRLSLSLTLRELAARSSVSISHVGRIDRGERFPSAHILRKMAKPLGFDEDELFMLAGFLSLRSPTIAENDPVSSGKRLDPYVATVLAQEPVEVQRAVIGILSILRNLAKNIKEEYGYR